MKKDVKFYEKEVTVVKCEHIENGALDYLSLVAGEKLRFHVCRLCTNVFLGAVISARISDSIKSITDDLVSKP
jgi:hypothetical protein